jgi:hypothetical protein
MTMKIIGVTDRKTRKMFLDTSRKTNKNDPDWSCPLHKEIEAIFDPGRNPYFEHLEAEYIRVSLRKAKPIIDEEFIKSDGEKTSLSRGQI